MNVSYTITKTVRISDCDAAGRWRVSAILIDTQELAEIHAATLGLSRAFLIEKGMCWVLYRQQVVMHRYPTFGEEVVLTTWPGKVEGPMFPRHYTITTPDGAPVGEIVTTWVLMDIHTRRPMRPSALPGTLPADESRKASLPLPGMLRITGAAPREDRVVRYSDLDVNGHMNNTRYIDWICDLLDLQTLHARGLASLQINYISEALGAETLTLATLADDAGGLLVQGTRASDGRTVFESAVSYLPQA